MPVENPNKIANNPIQQIANKPIKPQIVNPKNFTNISLQQGVSLNAAQVLATIADRVVIGKNTLKDLIISVRPKISAKLNKKTAQELVKVVALTLDEAFKTTPKVIEGINNIKEWTTVRLIATRTPIKLEDLIKPDNFEALKNAFLTEADKKSKPKSNPLDNITQTTNYQEITHEESITGNVLQLVSKVVNGISDSDISALIKEFQLTGVLS